MRGGRTAFAALALFLCACAAPAAPPAREVDLLPPLLSAPAEAEPATEAVDVPRASGSSFREVLRRCRIAGRFRQCRGTRPRSGGAVVVAQLECGVTEAQPGRSEVAILIDDLLQARHERRTSSAVGEDQCLQVPFAKRPGVESAGAQRTAPVRISNLAPCQGHVTS